MPLLKFPRASLLVHPSFIALFTWSMVALLYSMHLSGLLRFETSDVIQAFFVIVLPIVATSLVYRVLRPKPSGTDLKTVLRWEPSLKILDQRLQQGLRLWIALAVIETIFSRGVPIVWILIGNGKTNQDYGIPIVHGMVNVLMVVLAVTNWALYLYTGQRRYLRFPLFAVIWFFIIVSRGNLLVLLLECAVVFLRLKRINWSGAMRLFATALIPAMLFGYIGDVRSGAEAFRVLAQPTENFPEWAPSQLLWPYIYITTPLNNLLLTIHTRTPSFNVLLPSTFARLLPTPIRNRIYGQDAAADATNGELENESLVASTAYVGPFEDMGYLGIAGFGIIVSLFCQIFWYKNGFWSIFAFAVFTHALVLSLFADDLFSASLLGQLGCFYYLCRAPRTKVLTTAAQPV